MQTTFNLAHFSDLHFSTSPNYNGYVDAPGVVPKLRTRLSWLVMHGGNRRRLLSSFNIGAARVLSYQFANGLNHREYAYDGFVVTGDLATVGTRDDLEIARLYFEGRLLDDARGKPSNFSYISTFKFPVNALAILPGNHDRFDGLLCKPGSDEFERSAAFNQGWCLPASNHAIDQGNSVRSFTFSKDGSSLTVLAADFSLKGECHWNPWKYLGRGYVDKKTLESLVVATQACQGKSAVIWAVHFPPGVEPLKRSLRLGGEDRLIAAAASTGVEYILAGHTHISRVDRYPSGRSQSKICVICSGSPFCGGTKTPSLVDLEIHVCGDKVKIIRPAILTLKEFQNKDTKERVRRFTPAI